MTEGEGQMSAIFAALFGGRSKEHGDELLCDERAISSDLRNRITELEGELEAIRNAAEDSEPTARWLAWIEVGDRLPFSEEDEKLVRTKTAYYLALAEKLATHHGLHFSLKRIDYCIRVMKKAVSGS